MKLRLTITDIQRFLIYIYLALKVIFQGYSNTLELVITTLIFLINILIICRHKLSAMYVKVIIGCVMLAVWIGISIVLGQSSGNIGPVLMLIEFMLCMVNITTFIEFNSLKDKKKLYKFIYLLIVISLIYNITSFLLHPEYRMNLYLSTQAKGRFIGGITYSMFIGFFAIIQLNDLLFKNVKYKAVVIIIKIIALCAAIYYLFICYPSATVIIVSLFTAIVTTVLTWGKKNGKMNGIIIGVLAVAIIGPVIMWILLGFAVKHIDTSSRLYERIKAIIAVINSPNEILSNTYFSRFAMAIDEIKLTFSSIKVFIFGKGYNFGLYSSVAQQMENLGIGYHSSMIDWFPTFGFISGFLLWRTIFCISKYINRLKLDVVVICIWTAYIVYCFLNSGFNSLIIIVAFLFIVIHQQIVKQSQNDIIQGV